MLVGGRDTGKTTVTEPAAHIYKTMITPQADSFCPLEGIRGHELFLWQDFRYNPGHPDKNERGLRVDEGTWNRLLEGLPTSVGVPKTDGSRGDFTYKEDAAFIFTGPFEWEAYRKGRFDRHETQQLSTRVCYIHFDRPAAAEHTGRALAPCPLCWSRWILAGEMLWRRNQQMQPDVFAQRVIQALGLAAPTPTPPTVTLQQFEASVHTQALPARAIEFDDPAEQVLRDMEAAGLSGPPIGLRGGSRPTTAQSVAAPPTSTPDSSASSFFERLSALMSWKSQGLLTDAEFTSAKRTLGL